MNIFRMNIMRGGGYENTSNYVHRLGGVDFAFRSARGHNGSAGFDLVYAGLNRRTHSSILRRKYTCADFGGDRHIGSYIGCYPTHCEEKLAVTIQHTNADRCIGGEAVVLERIDNISETGSVKIDGKVWTARSSSGDIVESGEIVRVDKIDGVKLLVSKK